MRGGSIDTIEKIEAASAQIDAFIERRAKGVQKATAEEMAWKASVRKYNAHHERERLMDRLGYHRAMIEAHTRNFEQLLKRHRVGLRLVEEALGITHNDDKGAA